MLIIYRKYNLQNNVIDKIFLSQTKNVRIEILNRTYSYNNFGYIYYSI